MNNTIDDFKIFEDVNNEIIKESNRDLYLIEQQYTKLIEKINHQKCSLEFKRKYGDCVGEIIFVNDPIGDEEVDNIINSEKSYSSFRMKVDSIILKCNIKTKIPTAKYSTIGFSKYHYDKYLKKDIYLIIGVPNFYFYKTEKEYTLPNEYKFYLLNLKKVIPETTFNNFVYFTLDSLFDFELIKKGQTQLMEYLK